MCVCVCVCVCVNAEHTGLDGTEYAYRCERGVVSAKMGIVRTKALALTS